MGSRENFDRVTEGFSILNEMLAPFVAQSLKSKFGDNWWQEGVLDILRDEQKRDLPLRGSWGELVDSLDPARSLLLIDLHWNSVFRLRMSREQRNWVKELQNTRNRWAHNSLFEMDDDDAWRALDTMARLLEQIDAENTEKLRALAREVRYGTSGASTQAGPAVGREQRVQAGRAEGVLTEVPRPGLKPWRLVVEPHPDVAEGRYRQAEFAADLSQVLRGTAAVEYQDPVEFFARTYITEGMRRLLIEAAKRLSGQGGEPVVQLKTAFGGGKTHSMLALYHLFREKKARGSLPNVSEVMKAAGFENIPAARVAVLVGTELDPNRVRRPPNLPGLTIRTLWGEIAAQLAEQAGNLKLYDIIRDSDKNGISPGSDTLKELLDACGPCLIIMDELVAYARKIYGASGLPGGTFDNFLTFIQELTEAVIKTRNCMLIAAVPESDIEIGGEAGKIALEHIEHIFGRVEAIWRPVGAEEGFEIVRRRLFLEPQDTAVIEDVCRAFSEMYRSNSADFPAECRELAYLERMKACYPIHPEVFDLLYNEWATLERFQKTRGVLRLMAMVIHHLWINQDAGLMIMPSSIPLDSSIVRDELTRYLNEGWNAVVERDIDGPRSLPYEIDRENQRFGRVMAARRVARTIFLGSAVSSREQQVRGIEEVHIRLGTVQPGEQIAVFIDALNRAVERLTYLYKNRDRYWYDTIPNLNRTVEDRAQQCKPDEINHEIEKRLRSSLRRGDFAAVHTVFNSSDDVPDIKEARLVVLGPSDCHKRPQQDSAAIRKAQEVLQQRAGGPRMYRNMLVFAAADRDILDDLRRDVRYYLAWNSVLEDYERLNLDAAQQRQAEENRRIYNENVNTRLQETYCWLLVPEQNSGIGPLEWEAVEMRGADNITVKAARTLKACEHLIFKWAAAPLRLELDRWLWKDSDHISVGELWNYLTSYCYLPRLRDETVLLEAIKDGLLSDDFFGYAQGIAPDGTYQGLRLGQEGPRVEPDMSGYLVKPEAARRQLEARRARTDVIIVQTQPHTSQTTQPETGGDESVLPTDVETPAAPSRPRRFYAAARLDPQRVGRDAGRIAEEIIQHLLILDGADVEVTLEIQAKVPEGIPDSTVRIVKENCRTLKFKDDEYGFEEE